MSSFNNFTENERFSSSSIASAARFDTREDCAELLAALDQVPTLKAIVLGGNTYSEEASACIAELLRTKNQLEFFDGSDMFTTRLKTVVPPALKDICLALAETSVSYLDVSDNALGPPGTASVTNLIALEQFKGLRINNCGIGTGGAIILSNLFRNLSGVPCISLEDAIHEDLKEILEDLPKTEFVHEQRCDIALETLIVGRNRFKIDGAEALSYGIPYLKKLKIFRAPSNSIPSEGLIQILNALNDCPDLEVLDINDNTLNPEGVDALLACIESHPKLREISVGDCSIEEDGCLRVLKSLDTHCPLLAVLDLTYNELNNEGGELLVSLIEKRNDLAKLELNGSCLSSSTIKAIEKALANQGHEDALGTMSDNEDEEEEEEEDENVSQLTEGITNLKV